MLFNSFVFLLAFLPVALAGYFCVNRWGTFLAGKCWLILASLVFYAYCNVAYLPIIVVSLAANYGLGHCMRISERRWLRCLCFAVGLVGNIGALGYYKYYDFFVSNINQAFGTDFVLLKLVLPLGISFFTFKQLSYVIDSYKRVAPRYDFADYALYVTFFPQLIAGPIALHNEIAPQFADPANRSFRADHFCSGLFAFAMGLAKKVLIADTFAKAANYGFASVVSLNSLEALLVTLAFPLQLYFDFSGYSDMSIGLSLMFNIDAPVNFNSPYKSLNIQEFWNRWHITLGRFLMRYLLSPLYGLYKHIPLRGKHTNEIRACLSLMIVFWVSGLWHGAGWLFLLWGTLHGVASVAYRLCRKRYDVLPKALRRLLTFAFVSLAFVFFRAETVESALNILAGLGRFRFGPVAEGITSAFSLPFGLLRAIAPYMTGVWFGLALLSLFALPNVPELARRFKPSWQNGLFTVGLLLFSILSLSGISVFLYFNF